MSVFEGLKLERPKSFLAWGAAALFLLSGLALTPIATAWPVGVAYLGGLVANPVTWFAMILAVYTWYRQNWLKHPASDFGYDETKLPEPLNVHDPEAGARLQVLERNHGNLRDQFTTLVPRVEALEKKVAPLDKERRTALLAELKELVKAARPHNPREPAPPETESRRVREAMKGDTEHRMIALLRQLGVDYLKFQTEMNDRLLETKNDPAHYIREPGEEKLWSSNQAKREWYMQNTRAYVYEKALETIRL